MPSKHLSNEPIKPLLFRSMEVAEKSDAPLAIVASEDRWNDFGYSILAHIGFRLKTDNRIMWANGKLAVRGKSVLRDLALSLLEGGRASAPLDAAGEPFAALLMEVKMYAALRMELGVVEARQRLEAIHDVALLFAEGRVVPGWSEFFESKVFAQSMVRSSEAYLALRQGARHLTGALQSEVDIRNPFEASLLGRQPRLNFSFRFEQKALRGRIAVLVGRNGLGKTTSLAKLARALVDRRYAYARLEPRPEVNQVLAFAHSSSLPLFKQRSGEGSARVRLFSLDAQSRQKKDKDKLSVLLWEITRGFDGTANRLRTLHGILQAEFPSLLLAVPVNEGGRIDLGAKGAFEPLYQWAYRSEQFSLDTIRLLDKSRDVEFLDDGQKVRKLSLGQQAFIRFVLIALAHAGPGSVILVDEPENFLHPNLISRFMRVLNEVLKDARSIAIVATHSPFVVREVQAEQVHILADVDGGTFVTRPRLQTLGANVASISDEVFGDDLHQHLYEELLDAEEFGGTSISDLITQYEGELSVEALMLVRSRLEGSL